MPWSSENMQSIIPVIRPTNTIFGMGIDRGFYRKGSSQFVFDNPRRFGNLPRPTETIPNNTNNKETA